MENPEESHIKSEEHHQRSSGWNQDSETSPLSWEHWMYCGVISKDGMPDCHPYPTFTPERQFKDTNPPSDTREHPKPPTHQSQD